MAVSRIIIIPVLAAIVCLCYCEARYPQLELTQQQHQQQQQQQQQSIINTHPNEIEAAENSELVLSRKKRFALISYIALIFILVNVVMMVMSNIFVDIQHVGMDDNNSGSNNNDDSPIFTMIDKFEALVRDHQESTTTTLEPLTWTSERTTTTTLTPTPIPPLYLQGRNDDSDEGDLTISAEMEHNQMLREILKNKFRLNTLQGEEREKLLAVLTEQRQRLMGYTSTSSATTTTTIATTTTTTTSTASSTTATTTTTTTTTTLPKILVFLENEGNEEEEFNSADEDPTVSTEIDVLPVKRPFPWTFTETPQNENDDDYNYEESNRNDFTFDYSKWLQRHAGSNKILQKGRQHHQERQKRSAAVNEGDEEEELDSADEDLSNMVSTEIDVRPEKRWPFTKTPRNENDDNYNYEKSNRNHFTFDYSKWLQQHAGSNKILQKSRQHHQERVKRTSFPVHQPQPTSSSPVLPPSIGILGLIVLLINGIWYLSSKSSATTTASSLLPSDTAAVLPEKTANSDKTLKLVQLLEDFAYDIINDLFGEGASDNLTSTTTTTAPTTQIYVTRDFLYSSSTTATTTTTTKTTTTATTTTPTPRTTDKNVLMFTLPTEPPFIKDGDDSNDVMDIAPIYTPATLTKSTPSDLDKVTSTKKVPRTYKRPSPASNGVVSIRADPFSSKIVIDDEFADEELEVRPWVVFSSLKMTSSVTSEEAESREDYAPQKFSSPEKKSSKKNNVMKQLMRQKGQQLLAQGDVISDRGNLGQPAEKQELWQILGKKKRKRK